MYEGLNSLTVQAALRDFFDNSAMCGFELYVAHRDEPKLRRVWLSEEARNGAESFRQKTQAMILDVMKEKYLGDQIEFADAKDIADNQRKQYVITQVENQYAPFAYLDCSPIDFQDGDLVGATGLVFSFRKGTDTLCLYQHLWGINIPNKKKTGIAARLIKVENKVVFDEQREDMLTIGKKIDIAILNKYIITDNIQLPQKSFGFHEFIRATAEHTIASIVGNGIVRDQSKLMEYMNHAKPKYAKKLMKVVDSKVLQLQPAQMIHKVQTVERWKNVFAISDDNKEILLKTFVHVEKLIDLLDERYTFIQQVN